MKYKILEQNENNIQIFCLYDDKTFALLDLVAGREIEEILQDAYILTKNKENRQVYNGEEIEDLKDYIPKPKVARLDVDFYNLSGKVFDQYGDVLDAPISFTVEGTDKAKIEKGKLIEEEVEEEASFFIVAKVGDLEQKEERFLYPKPEIKEPSPEDAPITRKEYNELLNTQDAIMLAQTQMYEESEKRADEIMLAMTEIYETKTGEN